MKTGLPKCDNFMRISFAGTHCINVSVGKHHVELTYDPMHFNAVACSGSHIFVADSTPGGGVHIHSWRGQHTQSLSHGLLGLQDYDWIWAINHTNYDDILQVAVGDHNSETVHSLHACKVSDFQSDIALDDNISEDSISFLNSLICIYLHNYLTGSYHTSTQVVIH